MVPCLRPALLAAVLLLLLPGRSAGASNLLRQLRSVEGNVNLQPQFKTFGGAYEEKLSNIAGIARWHGATRGVGLFLGVATKGSSPRSLFNHVPPTGDDFDVDVQLHTVAVEFARAGWRLRAGKLPRGPLLPSDFLWDSDIHPWGAVVEGRALGARWQLGIVESPDDDWDSWGTPMGLAQLFVDRPWRGGSATASVGTLPVLGLRGESPRFSAGTNSRAADGTIDIDLVPLVATLDLRGPREGAVRHRLFAEAVVNVATGGDNLGLTGGLVAQSPELRRLGDWRVQLMYRWLQRDAWLDVLPDVSSANGRTGVHGAELIVIHPIRPWLRVDVDAYRMEADVPQGDGTYFYVQVKNKLLF
jgi:hypothetical protein